MAYWLLKSEPFKFSWQQLVQAGQTNWDGVRNYQAANNLRAMQVGDEAFFYHSNEGKEIVGICRISATATPDPSDATGKFVMVKVVPVAPLAKPVPLATLKAHPQLAGMALLKQSRLSVSPVRAAEWKIIAGLGAAKT